jgi:hypothetical protein
MTNAQSKMMKEPNVSITYYGTLNQSTLIHVVDDYTRVVKITAEEYEKITEDEKNMTHFTTTTFDSELMLDKELLNEVVKYVKTNVLAVVKKTIDSEWYENFPTKHRKSVDEMLPYIKRVELTFDEFKDKDVCKKLIRLVNYMIDYLLTPKKTGEEEECEEVGLLRGEFCKTGQDKECDANYNYFGGRVVRANGQFDKSAVFGIDFSLLTTKEYKLVYKMEQIRKCEYCKKTTKEKGETQRCSGCDCVRYCGLECQKADWKSHKPFCKKLQPIRKTAMTFTELNSDRFSDRLF